MPRFAAIWAVVAALMMASPAASLAAGGSSKGKILLISLDPLAIPIVDNGKIKGKITSPLLRSRFERRLRG